MALVKAIFYLPLRDNDGRRLRKEIRETVLEVYRRFHGWTALGYLSSDCTPSANWYAPRRNTAYAIILDESRVDELEQVLRDFKNKTTQEAIYLEVQHNIEFRFVR